jgi:hypothetical protein
MPSSTENVKLGVCHAIFDGDDLGYTKGGVEVEVSTSTHEVTVDQFGETPIGELIIGRTVKATVPLAETTLDNLIATMPGSTLISDGTRATGTVTFASTAPINNDALKVGDVTFTWRTVPVTVYDLPIVATFSLAAAAFAAAVNASPCGYTATVAAGVVTMNARTRGTVGNITLVKTGGTSFTVVNPNGGINPTKAKVVVATGVNLNLLSFAKTLVLRPRGTTGEDDFVIHRAATAGALNFSYMLENERIYSTEFKGYVAADGSLFTVGNSAA